MQPFWGLCGANSENGWGNRATPWLWDTWDALIWLESCWVCGHGGSRFQSTHTSLHWPRHSVLSRHFISHCSRSAKFPMVAWFEIVLSWREYVWIYLWYLRALVEIGFTAHTSHQIDFLICLSISDGNWSRHIGPCLTGSTDVNWTPLFYIELNGAFQILGSDSEMRHWEHEAH
jgi:hypothetical protein